MSHHSSDHPLTHLMSNTAGTTDRLAKLLKDELGDLKEKQLQSTLGPTGDHPHGRIVPHDEGGLMFGVTVFNGRVIFDFGKPVRSIGFTREGALELAELIRQRAEQCPAVLFTKRG